MNDHGQPGEARFVVLYGVPIRHLPARLREEIEISRHEGKGLMIDLDLGMGADGPPADVIVGVLAEGFAALTGAGLSLVVLNPGHLEDRLTDAHIPWVWT